MSDQQSQQQDNQLEPQQHDRQVVLPPRVPPPHVLPPHVLAIFRITVILWLLYIAMMEQTAAHSLHIPYHTSALSGAGWVHELLTGHPQRIQTELGVYQSMFTLLVKVMQRLGIQSLHHVSIEEQLAIFLYTTVTGLTCIHVGERFQ
jgi:hypothetical protein